MQIKNSEVNTPEGRTNTVYGWRFTSIRTLKGFKAKEVAELAGIPTATYSRIERNDSYQLTDAQLESLSLVLGMPPSWFTQEQKANLSETPIHFRKNSKMTRGSEMKVKFIQEFFAEMVAVLNQKVRLVPLLVPQVSPVAYSPEHAAQQTRKALRLTDEQPISNVIRSAERLGVFVTVLDFDAQLHLVNHDASSAWATLEGGDSRPLVLCRVNTSWDRMRLSAAHELGHLVMHRYGAGVDKEEEAFRFACEYIFPAKTLETQWPGPNATLSQIFPLKSKWGMSLAALIMHAFRNGLIDEHRKANLFAQLSNGKDLTTGLRWRKREPGYNDRQIEKPLLLANAVEVAYGTPPNLNEFLDTVTPDTRHFMFKDYFYNLDTVWSRELSQEHQERIFEEIAQSKPENVIYADFGAR